MPARLGFAIDVKVDLAPMNRKVNSWARKCADLSPVFRSKIAPDAARQLDRNWASRGSYLGSSWAPNTEVTIGLKGHDRVMEDSGETRRQLTSARAGRRVFRRQEMIFGADVAHAAFAHEGFWSTWAGRFIAARPLFPANGQWPHAILSHWAGMIVAHVEQDRD
jgi:hypothetical protein